MCSACPIIASFHFSAQHQKSKPFWLKHSCLPHTTPPVVFRSCMATAPNAETRLRRKLQLVQESLSELLIAREALATVRHTLRRTTDLLTAGPPYVRASLTDQLDEIDDLVVVFQQEELRLLGGLTVHNTDYTPSGSSIVPDPNPQVGMSQTLPRSSRSRSPRREDGNTEDGSSN